VIHFTDKTQESHYVDDRYHIELLQNGQGATLTCKNSDALNAVTERILKSQHSPN